MPWARSSLEGETHAARLADCRQGPRRARGCTKPVRARLPRGSGALRQLPGLPARCAPPPGRPSCDNGVTQAAGPVGPPTPRWATSSDTLCHNVPRTHAPLTPPRWAASGARLRGVLTDRVGYLHRLTPWALCFRLVAQIHDELLFEVEDAQVPEFAGEPRGDRKEGTSGSARVCLGVCSGPPPPPHAACHLHPGHSPMDTSAPRGLCSPWAELPVGRAQPWALERWGIGLPGWESGAGDAKGAHC